MDVSQSRPDSICCFIIGEGYFMETQIKRADGKLRSLQKSLIFLILEETPQLFHAPAVLFRVFLFQPCYILEFPPDGGVSAQVTCAAPVPVRRPFLEGE